MDRETRVAGKEGYVAYVEFVLNQYGVGLQDDIPCDRVDELLERDYKAGEKLCLVCLKVSKEPHMNKRCPYCLFHKLSRRMCHYHSGSYEDKCKDRVSVRYFDMMYKMFKRTSEDSCKAIPCVLAHSEQHHKVVTDIFKYKQAPAYKEPYELFVDAIIASCDDRVADVPAETWPAIVEMGIVTRETSFGSEE